MGAKGNSGAAAPSAEIRKRTAATINPPLRPMRVLTHPPMSPPMMQPMSALELTMPQRKLAAFGAEDAGAQ